MKRAVFMLFLFVLLLCGCRADIPEFTTVKYDYIYRTTEEEEVTSGYYTEESSDEITEEEGTSVEEETTMSSVQETTTSKNTIESTTSEVPASEKEEATTVKNTVETTYAAGEVDLSISMPEKNGTMVVDTSSDNKFVVIVRDERGIDSSLLAAVYSVPESGQNYVFEFTAGKERSADSLRRVYLIDANGKITGVAATNSSEMENVSSVENWFCMNVLIKELIYPSVEKEIKG